MQRANLKPSVSSGKGATNKRLTAHGPLPALGNPGTIPKLQGITTFHYHTRRLYETSTSAFSSRLSLVYNRQKENYLHSQ